MKKILPVLALVFATLLPMQSFAEDTIIDSFFVYSPRIMAQGGSFTAIASGHESLYTNPAGFYSKSGSLTIGSFTGWAFMNPVGVMVATGAMTAEEALSTYGYTYGSPYTFGTAPEQLAPSDPLYANPGDSNYESNADEISSKAMLAFFKDQAKYGFGGGGSLGISWVGGGLGLGFIASTNLFMQGDTFPFGISGMASTTLAVVGGYAMPFQIGNSRLIIGADLRPMIRVYSKIDASTASGLLTALGVNTDGTKADSGSSAVFAALNGTSAYQGAGLGIDLGAKWELGAVTLGLSVRDVFGTRISMYRHKLGDYLNYVYSNGGLPSNESYTGADGTTSTVVQADGTFVIPMVISAGVAFHPDLGGLSFLFDPTIQADIVDPLGVIRDQQSPWALLHIGTEVKVLRFIKLRAGINQGYVT
ncbi:MAG: hypothetical protein WCT14_20925, partial [Treponemataceae bacterium]